MEANDIYGLGPTGGGWMRLGLRPEVCVQSFSGGDGVYRFLVGSPADQRVLGGIHGVEARPGDHRSMMHVTGFFPTRDSFLRGRPLPLQELPRPS